jgi:enoyl-CoA hydratase/carnithine racemase
MTTDLGGLRPCRTDVSQAARTSLNTPSRLDANGLLEAALAEGLCVPSSALSGCPCLLVDLGPDTSLRPFERQALVRWLERQACPVLGVAADDLGHPLACACDAVVARVEDADELISNIQAAPLAALVLVQLLRATEGLDVSRALIFESLAYATLQAGAEFRGWLSQAPPSPTGAATACGAPLLLEREGSHLRLRLNRPAKRNALSVEMRDALVEALELVAADSSIVAVTISGEGRCFSAGGDLTEFGSAPDPAVAHAVRASRSVPGMLARCAARLTFRVHGAAVGAGVEMAAFGARVEATADAFFQLPEIRYGLIPGCGGCVSIPRRIGRLRTGYLALSARRLDARTAQAWGLVDALTESKPQTMVVPA